MAETIAGSSGFILGAESVDLAVGEHEELLEVPLDAAGLAVGILGLLQLLVERCGLLAVDRTLSMTGKVTPHVIEQYSRMSSIFDNSCRNWLHGKPRTSNPRSP